MTYLKQCPSLCKFIIIGYNVEMNESQCGTLEKHIQKHVSAL